MTVSEKIAAAIPGGIDEMLLADHYFGLRVDYRPAAWLAREERVREKMAEREAIQAEANMAVIFSKEKR